MPRIPAYNSCVPKLQQYEEWKKNLPDTDWIKGLIPVIEADKFRTGISKAADGIKGKANEIDLDPAPGKGPTVQMLLE